MRTIRREREVKIVIPIETAQLLCERAEEKWHTHAGVVTGGNRVVIQVWPARHMRLGLGSVPLGSFTLHWNRPLPSEATIVRLEWDAEHDGSEDAIRQAINNLVGWPIAIEPSGRRMHPATV